MEDRPQGSWEQKQEDSLGDWDPLKEGRLDKPSLQTLWISDNMPKKGGGCWFLKGCILEVQKEP